MTEREQRVWDDVFAKGFVVYQTKLCGVDTSSGYKLQYLFPDQRSTSDAANWARSLADGAISELRRLEREGKRDDG